MQIYEYAVDNYGLITSSQARAIGIPTIELVKLAHRGRLLRLGYGIYKIAQYVPTPLDKYAEAVAFAGEGAYISGESVLAMHNLAFVNPSVIFITVPHKIRKKLPVYVRCIAQKNQNQITAYEGIPSQSVFDAIMECQKTVMSQRLKDAIREAKIHGLITEKEAAVARRKLK